MNKNSKIYIAGHTGMVGSAITRKLRAKGYTNIIGRTMEELDLTDQQAVSRFFETGKPEVVVLAAAKVGGIMANDTYRAQFIYENLMIEANIIHQAYLHGVKKLLFLGSSCIYPKNAPQPLKEEYLLTGELEQTNEPYAIAKIAGIKLCESYYRQYGCNFISVMPTNLYGPNDNYNLETSHVLPALVRKMHLGKCLENNDWNAIKNDLKKYPIEGVTETASESDILNILSKYGIQRETINDKRETIGLNTASRKPQAASPVSITLWGTGTPYREFLYVDDLAEACVFVMTNINFNDLKVLPSALSSLPCALSPAPLSEIRNTHINIGTGKDITIKDLAELIKGIIGFKGQLNWDSSKPDGTPRKLLDVSKIKRLGWKENIGLDEGILKIYDAYSNF